MRKLTINLLFMLVLWVFGLAFITYFTYTVIEKSSQVKTGIETCLLDQHCRL